MSWGTLSRGLTYAYLPDRSEPMKLVAALLNYAMLTVCMVRFRQVGLYQASAFIVFFSCIAFYFDDSVVGLSTTWCFAYGFCRNKRRFDHLFFWCAISSVFILYAAATLLALEMLWPWPHVYFYIANMAHVLSALAGFGVSKVMDERKVQGSLHGFRRSVVDGHMSRRGAELNDHNVVNVAERTEGLTTVVDRQCSSKKHMGWDLHRFMHTHTIEQGDPDSNTLTVTESFRWHPCERGYKSEATCTYQVVENDKNLHANVKSWKFKMTGLPPGVRQAAEKHMRRNMPQKHARLLREYVNTVN